MIEYADENPYIRQHRADELKNQRDERHAAALTISSTLLRAFPRFNDFVDALNKLSREYGSGNLSFKYAKRRLADSAVLASLPTFPNNRQKRKNLSHFWVDRRERLR